MSVQDRIKMKLEAEATVDMEFAGEKLKINLLSMTALNNLFNLNDEEFFAVIRANILDPETMEPAFDIEYLKEGMTNVHIDKLTAEFIRINKNIDTSLEDLEKNLQTTDS